MAPETQHQVESPLAVLQPGIKTLPRPQRFQFPRAVLTGWFGTSPLAARLARSTVWSVAGALASRALGLLATILIARILGAEKLGQLGLIQATITLLGTAGGAGLGLTANKHLSEYKHTDPPRAGRILGLSSTLAWLLGGGMALLLVSCAPWISSSLLGTPELSTALQAGAVLLLCTAVNGAQTGALCGLEAFKPLAAFNVASGLLTVGFVLTGAWIGGVTGTIWGFAVSQAANCLLAYFILHGECRRKGLRFDYRNCFQEGATIWSFSLPASLNALLTTLVAWGGYAWLANQPSGFSELGVYNAALRIKLVPEAMVAMLVLPIVPVLSEAYSRSDKTGYTETLGYYIWACALVTVPIALIQTALPFLTLLPYGREFSGHGWMIAWLMLHSILTGVIGPIQYVYISMGRMWLVAWLGVGFAVSHATTAYFLVPAHGATGFAASLALSYALVNIPALILLRIRQPAVVGAARWLRVLFAAIAGFVWCALAAGTAQRMIGLLAGLPVVVAFTVFLLKSARSRQKVRPQSEWVPMEAPK